MDRSTLPRSSLRRTCLLAILAVVLLAAAACLPDPSTVAAGKRILVIGDSLTVEAAQAYADGSDPGEAFHGLTVDWFAAGGTAPCDFLGKVTAEAASFHPTNTVFAFTGNHQTSCMNGRASTLIQMVNSYLADYVTLMGQIGTGYFAWVVPPMSRPNVEARAAVGCDPGANVLANTAFCPQLGLAPVSDFSWHGDGSIGNADCLIGIQYGRCDTQIREILGQDWSTRQADGLHLTPLYADTYARAILAATVDQ